MAQITPFIMTRDINGFNGFGLPFSNNKYQSLLTGDVEDTVTVPPTGMADYPNVLAVFSFPPASSVWVSLNATATIPTGSFSSCSSELNPASRKVSAGDVLHFITSDDQDEIGVIFYATT